VVDGIVSKEQTIEAVIRSGFVCMYGGVRDFIVHDRDQVDRVYQVIHLPGDGDPTREEVADINDYLKSKYTTALNHLATGQPPANSEEQYIADMFKGEPPSAYAVAAQNLRVQQGLRERFREGLLRSEYYRPTMERIFRDAGLPPELVTLATVESGFYSRAKSSAGAVGIWQFTRGTGKEYMRITRYHDDRFDPTAETRAAAALLRSNYDTLGSWPLAITAYNYGTGGTSAAAAEYGGDYGQIVRNYNGPHLICRPQLLFRISRRLADPSGRGQIFSRSEGCRGAGTPACKNRLCSAPASAPVASRIGASRDGPPQP
jgi:Transglycosylase SLT domain